MKHPPYHLRTNKAVDRFILLEAIRKLQRIGDLSEYTYYGLGGPYLEDFRFLYEFFPELGMVSIEKDADTIKRQEFHLPCGTLRLEHAEFSSFLAQYDSKGKKSIFWLDYTGLTLGAFEDFQVLLGNVATNSMIKITLRAEPSDYHGKADDFRAQFGALMQNPSADPPGTFRQFAGFVQDMLRIAVQEALPAAMGRTFQTLTSFCYADGAGIFTLTGIVCQGAGQTMICDHFKNWPFANLNWGNPKLIDVPFLSTKERQHLQKHLPCDGNTGQRLLTILGYSIGDDRKMSIKKLKQYADFHRCFPYFLRAMP